MTEEEAKKQIIDMANALQLIPNTPKGKAVSMALKALERESVLDKIRDEIEGYRSTIDNAISEDELKIEGMKEAYADCLKIIDKYKESEGKG